MQAVLSSGLPKADSFIALRAACGWGEISLDCATRALHGGIATVTAYDAGRLVGFGRVVGDGALYFYLQDIIVVPSHRGQGLAKAMVARLLTQIEPLTAPGATIGLMAAKGVEPLYEPFGFVRRPSDTTGAGMTKGI